MSIELSRHPSVVGGGRVFAFASQVGFDELDLYGIVHHTRFPVHMERAVLWFYYVQGLLAQRDHEDLYHFVRELRVEYLYPRTSFGLMRVELWVRSLTTSSCTYEMLCCADDSDEAYARGSRSIVKIDREAGRKRAWTDAFRRAHEPLVRDRPE